MAEAPPVVPVGNAATVTGGIDPALLARALSAMFTPPLDALGEHEVADIQESLSVPVGFTVGLGGMTQTVQRSAPGEEPRKEYGVLQRNVRHEVIQDDAGLPMLRIESTRPAGDAASGQESSDDPRAPYVLEFELNRPYMTPALVRLKGYARDFLSKFISQ